MYFVTIHHVTIHHVIIIMIKDQNVLYFASRNTRYIEMLIGKESVEEVEEAHLARKRSLSTKITVYIPSPLQGERVSVIGEAT